MTGARCLFDLCKVDTSICRAKHIFFPVRLQRSTNLPQNDTKKLTTLSPMPSKKISHAKGNPNNVAYCNVHILTSGKICDAPKRRSRFGVLKVLLTCIVGSTLGAWMSKTMVVVLDKDKPFILNDNKSDDDNDAHQNKGMANVLNGYYLANLTPPKFTTQDASKLNNAYQMPM